MIRFKGTKPDGTKIIGVGLSKNTWAKMLNKEVVASFDASVREVALNGPGPDWDKNFYGDLKDPPKPPRFLEWDMKYDHLGGCIWHDIRQRMDIRGIESDEDIVPRISPPKFLRCKTVPPDDPRRYPHWHHLPCPSGEVAWKLKAVTKP